MQVKNFKDKETLTENTAVTVSVLHVNFALKSQLKNPVLNPPSLFFMPCFFSVAMSNAFLTSIKPGLLL